jgi:hypothetical protein
MENECLHFTVWSAGPKYVNPFRIQKSTSIELTDWLPILYDTREIGFSCLTSFYVLKLGLVCCLSLKRLTLFHRARHAFPVFLFYFRRKNKRSGRDANRKWNFSLKNVPISTFPTTSDVSVRVWQSINITVIEMVFGIWIVRNRFQRSNMKAGTARTQ